MEITVINDAHAAGWLGAATRTGEVYMSDVNTMVANVMLAAGDRKITVLNVLDHGSASGINIGDDMLFDGNLGMYQSRLALLRPYFAASGYVHMQNCKAGGHEAVLKRLAAAFGVPVYAGTGNAQSVFRFNTGSYVVAHPDGKFEQNVSVPLSQGAANFGKNFRLSPTGMPR